MKKALVLFAALALTMAMASVALAEVTVDGSVEFLMRSIKNTSDWNDDTKTAGDYNLTYERVRLGFNAKHEGVKGRVQIENDWDVWGAPTPPATPNLGPNPGFETGRTGKPMYIREGWLDFNMPFGIPGHIKVGRQFLQLGNGWFFRSNKYGSDAWVVGFPGQNTFAFVDVKAAENNSSFSDDTDAYVLLDTYKINDTTAVGAYIAHIMDRQGTWANNAGLGPGITKVTLDNIGVHFNGMLGPVKLGAEVDYQMGDIEAGATTIDFGGYQLVVQADMKMDALNLNATVAMGTGDDPNSANEDEGYYAFMDKDPHYALVYEYYMVTAAGAKNTAFSNTTALNLGASFQLNPMFKVGAQLWMLTADQKFNNNGGTADDEVGNEIDIRLDMKIADPLTLTVVYGHFMPGKGYENAAGEADNATAWHGVLSYKF